MIFGHPLTYSFILKSGKSRYTMKIVYLIVFKDLSYYINVQFPYKELFHKMDQLLNKVLTVFFNYPAPIVP